MVVKVAIFAIGIPGVLAALFALLPRVTVAVTDPVDPDDPYSSSVTVTNTGYIPLDSVWPAIGLGEITTVGGPPPHTNMKWDYLPCRRRRQWKPRNLAIDDRFTFALNDVYELENKGTFQSADIAVIVDYELPLIHLARRKFFPIVSRKQTNGKFYWYAKTVD
jgi:hypothetical protein